MLLPKWDRDLREPSSYRLASLLNVDHKIFSQILAGRLNQLLEDYIILGQIVLVKIDT